MCFSQGHPFQSPATPTFSPLKWFLSRSSAAPLGVPRCKHLPSSGTICVSSVYLGAGGPSGQVADRFQPRPWPGQAYRLQPGTVYRPLPVCHPEASVGFQGCSREGKGILGHWAAPRVAGRIALGFQHLGDLRERAPPAAQTHRDLKSPSVTTAGGPTGCTGASDQREPAAWSNGSWLGGALPAAIPHSL